MAEIYQRAIIMSKKVSVIMGGTSSEREISLISGQTVAQALKTAGYQVGTIDIILFTIFAKVFPSRFNLYKLRSYSSIPNV